MTAYLVRHAEAGDRADWQGDDRLRPLTESGRRQAEALIQLHKNRGIEVVLSSPYLRCIETLEPLARHLRVTVQPEADLAEGAGADGVRRVLRLFPGRNLALCTHGDVLEEFLQGLIQAGILDRARARLEKASTWVISETAGGFSGADYIRPP